MPAKKQAAAEETPQPPTISPVTLAAMPGMSPAVGAEPHVVTINGTVYSWHDGEEDTVPAEAVEVYLRSVEANG